jgi:hypothetical protein
MELKTRGFLQPAQLLDGLLGGFSHSITPLLLSYTIFEMFHHSSPRARQLLFIDYSTRVGSITKKGVDRSSFFSLPANSLLSLLLRIALTR